MPRVESGATALDPTAQDLQSHFHVNASS